MVSTCFNPGWGKSIESHDLSSTSTKLLKMVVILKKLRICQRKMQKFNTYSDLSKALFCVSKYSELKNTRLQGEVVELFAEAKALVSGKSTCARLEGEMGCDYG